MPAVVIIRRPICGAANPGYGSCGDGRESIAYRPYRQCSGVAAGIIRIIGKLLNRGGQIDIRVQVELCVVGAVALGYLRDMAAFVKTSSTERDRKSFEARRGGLCGVVYKSGRIEAAAGPNSQRHVGNQMFSDGLAQ